MISRPSSVEVIAGIRTALRDEVAPHVGDGPASVTLGVIDALLGNLAVRVAHEIAWMRGEADTICTRVGAAVADLPLGAARTAIEDALAARTAQHVDALDLDVVQADYDRASNVLGLLTDAAFAADAEAARVAVRELLAHRSAHEAEVFGELVMVGRS